eukprot:2022487-Pleurochrysis_carterae.AAC.1
MQCINQSTQRMRRHGYRVPAPTRDLIFAILASTCACFTPFAAATSHCGYVEAPYRQISHEVRPCAFICWHQDNGQAMLSSASLASSPLDPLSSAFNERTN